MTQYALPNANSLNDGAYTQGAGDGDGDYFDELDEGFGAGRGTGSGPDGTTTYWGTGNNPSTQRLRCEIETVTDPVSSSGHIIRFQIRKNPSGARTLAFVGRLLENGTIRATLTGSEPGATFETQSYTLSAAEANAISDYSLLQLEVQFNVTGGGSPSGGDVSAMEFECPDAPPDTTDEEMAGARPLIEQPDRTPAGIVGSLP